MIEANRHHGHCQAERFNPVAPIGGDGQKPGHESGAARLPHLFFMCRFGWKTCRCNGLRY